MQGYWSGLPFLPPGDLPNPGIKPGSPVLPADSVPSEPQGKPVQWGGSDASSDNDDPEWARLGWGGEPKGLWGHQGTT